jgi:nucleotide-binding universal stress UspA family protein
VVVVGVDGSPASVEAARFAADEAAVRGLALVVVHAGARGVDQRPRDVAAAGALTAAGQALVDGTLSQVRVAPTTTVRTVVEAGPVAALLTAVSSDAVMVVLGQHRPDLADGRPAGHVAPELGARARCPVVVVPAGWTRTLARDARLARRPVVVGVGGTGSAAAVLEVAHEEAELRGESVLVLHVSTRAGPTSSRQAASARHLAQVMADQHRGHPDVAIDYRVVPGGTLLAWVDASARASLLVLGRPGSARGDRAWKQSVARALLHQTRCPLVVVPAVTRTVPEDRLRRGAPALVS